MHIAFLICGRAWSLICAQGGDRIRVRAWRSQGSLTLVRLRELEVISNLIKENHMPVRSRRRVMTR